MILLPHGCSCSELAVNPRNWKTGGKTLLKKKWRIHYYFRDPEFKDKYPYGKLIPIKGMNHFKTLAERRAATELLIDEEIYILKTKGYNPITKTTNGPEIELIYDIHPETKVNEAIQLAANKIEGEKSTLSDVKTAVKYFKKSCNQLRYHILKIEDLKRAHVKNILENQRIQNDYSNARYNKIRAYMHMVFNQLLESDAIEFNLVSGIKKKKETKKIKVTLSDEALENVRTHLKENHYTFYRYFEIFFRSGSRSTELFSLKFKDVDLQNQRFKVLVKKGKYYEEQWRAININTLHHWKELLNMAQPGDYMFSYDFSPGATKIQARQVSRKWNKYVKKKLSVTCDFYSMKHLYTTKVISLYKDRKLASGINGHKSSFMNDEHYDTLHRQRKLEEAKKINI
ncbi:tyrosine-type recombinase/integrase [Winogradskyella forsetii]|uniref:tyrosine-type recombinase/integrase n=1 Tax=Winogradskyella forsetii TaxID=2686077 RepID=UPI0015C0393C|nr:tyrosine-type recombinase/integrase [Winogradskyella forsetii]